MAPCQPLPQKRRRREPPARQVIAAPRSAGVARRDRCVSARAAQSGSPPASRGPERCPDCQTGQGLRGHLPVPLHPLCLSHAQALPFVFFLQCSQSLDKTSQTEQTQVLSIPAGVPKWETHPETWQRLRAVPVLGQRSKGRARLECLLSFSGCFVTDVPAGRAFPAPRPHPAPQSGWRRKGV